MYVQHAGVFREIVLVLEKMTISFQTLEKVFFRVKLLLHKGGRGEVRQ
jgi:hypothetical protein